MHAPSMEMVLRVGRAGSGIGGIGTAPDAAEQAGTERADFTKGDGGAPPCPGRGDTLRQVDLGAAADRL